MNKAMTANRIWRLRSPYFINSGAGWSSSTQPAPLPSSGTYWTEGGMGSEAIQFLQPLA